MTTCVSAEVFEVFNEGPLTPIVRKAPKVDRIVIHSFPVEITADYEEAVQWARQLAAGVRNVVARHAPDLLDDGEQVTL